MEVKNQKGFTLIELMMTLAIGAMITGAAYATYTSQQKAYYTQGQVAEMQQNLRAAFTIIASELRMVGYDPKGNGFVPVQATDLKLGRIKFQTDKDGNGIPETIAMGMSPTDDTIVLGTSATTGDGIPDIDSDSNGVPDPVSIGIDTGSGYQDIAENIQAIEFLYLKGDGTKATLPSEIRNVQVTILAVSPKADPNFTNTTQYSSPSPSIQKWGPYNDNYRRRLQSLRIRCRNLGL